jgi:DNA-binding transcriptional MerR regulator
MQHIGGYMSDFLTTNDAAKVLGKASATVLYYEKIGRLTPERTMGGVRLFSREQVERLAGELQKMKSAEACA